MDKELLAQITATLAEVGEKISQLQASLPAEEPSEEMVVESPEEHATEIEPAGEAEEVEAEAEAPEAPDRKKGLAIAMLRKHLQ